MRDESKRKLSILVELLTRKEGVTMAEASKALSCGRKSVYRYLHFLEERGVMIDTNYDMEGKTSSVRFSVDSSHCLATFPMDSLDRALLLHLLEREVSSFHFKTPIRIRNLLDLLSGSTGTVS